MGVGVTGTTVGAWVGGTVGVAVGVIEMVGLAITVLQLLPSPVGTQASLISMPLRTYMPGVYEIIFKVRVPAEND